MNDPHNLVELAAKRAAREPNWLGEASNLPADTIAALLPFYLPLAARIAELTVDTRVPIVVGIQGPQGAGKTTLAQLLQRVLHEVADLTVASLSIDDLYLTRAERAELAARVHPLFITRGVPGTHDVALGVQLLSALTRPGATRIPRFDKAQDDRAPEGTWPIVQGPCDVVLFEGLWIGLPPQDDAALRVPINTLEALEDRDGIWRGHANRALAQTYPSLFARCDLLVHVQVPDFSCVKSWRSGAEHALRARLQAQGADTSRVMDDVALARFFEHYERFTAHAMRVMPARADVILRLDHAHRPVAAADRELGRSW